MIIQYTHDVVEIKGRLYDINRQCIRYAKFIVINVSPTNKTVFDLNNKIFTIGILCYNNHPSCLNCQGPVFRKVVKIKTKVNLNFIRI